MNERAVENLAGALYEAHREAMGRSSVAGVGIPSWEDLKTAHPSLYGAKAQQAVQNQLRIRRAWVAVAEAADKHNVVDVSPAPAPAPAKAPAKKAKAKKAPKKAAKKAPAKKKAPRKVAKKKAAKRIR